jgi:metal-dependent amidase/aminoacylase/carboxypeptidase family protein
VILEGGVRANVVPDRARARFSLRAAESQYLVETVAARFRGVVDGVARATGTSATLCVCSRSTARARRVRCASTRRRTAAAPERWLDASTCAANLALPFLLPPCGVLAMSSAAPRDRDRPPTT